MPEEVEPVVESTETPKAEEAPKAADATKRDETPKAADAPKPEPKQESKPQGQQGKPQGGGGPRPDKGREDRPRGEQRGDQRGPRPGGGGGDNRGGGGDRGPRHEGRGGDRGGDRREGGRPGGFGGGRPFEGSVEIELEKLISDSLYLDNQAHVVVMRMRDMDSGTKSQLRRLYNAVRRAVRAPESERQHQFVMLRARLAYTIARHSLRSLDALERLLLQVTRKNDAAGYERFKDLFEAIVAYNE